MCSLNTFDRVKEIIMVTLGCEEDAVTPDANLFEDLGADSIDMIEMAVVIEEEFGLTISNEEVERLTTISNVIQYVDNHQ